MEFSYSHKKRMEVLLGKLSSFKISDEAIKKMQEEEIKWFEKTIENIAIELAKYSQQGYAYGRIYSGYCDHRNHNRDYAEKIKKYFVDLHFDVQIKSDLDDDNFNSDYSYSLILYKPSK